MKFRALKPPVLEMSRLKNWNYLTILAFWIFGIKTILQTKVAVFPDSGGYLVGKSSTSLSFSPRWRKDFSSLLLWRLLVYISFLSLKFVRNPIRMIFQLRNLATGRYQTKIEMTPVRGMKYIRIARQTKVND